MIAPSAVSCLYGLTAPAITGARLKVVKMGPKEVYNTENPICKQPQEKSCRGTVGCFFSAKSLSMLLIT